MTAQLGITFDLGIGSPSLLPGAAIEQPACTPADTYGQGYTTGYAAGYIAANLDGREFRKGLAIGQMRGRSDGYDEAFADGVSSTRFRAIGIGKAISGTVTDSTAPTVTWVSPTPGALPGAAGGFPADPNAAKVFPIVIQIGDTNPGVQYVTVVVVFTDEEGKEHEETIYRRTNFRGLYVQGSKAEMVGPNLQLTIRRNTDGGWLDFVVGVNKQFAIYADAIDKAGNVSVES